MAILRTDVRHLTLCAASVLALTGCDDTGVNNRLSRGDDDLVRASCAAAGEPLVVLPTVPAHPPGP